MLCILSSENSKVDTGWMETYLLQGRKTKEC